MRTLSDLPDELILEISEHLDPLSIVPLSKTSRKLRALLLTPEVLARHFRYKYELWNDVQGRREAKTPRQALLEADLSLRCLMSRKALLYRSVEYEQVQAEGGDEGRSTADEFTTTSHGRATPFDIFLSGRSGLVTFQDHGPNAADQPTQITVYNILTERIQAVITPPWKAAEEIVVFGDTVFVVETDKCERALISGFDAATGRLTETYEITLHRQMHRFSIPKLQVNDDYVVLILRTCLFYHARAHVSTAELDGVIYLEELAQWTLTPAMSAHFCGDRHSSRHSFVETVYRVDVEDFLRIIVNGTIDRDRLWIRLEDTHPGLGSPTYSPSLILTVELKHWTRDGILDVAYISAFEFPPLRHLSAVAEDLFTENGRAQSFALQRTLQQVWTPTFIPCPEPTCWPLEQSRQDSWPGEHPAYREFTYLWHLPATIQCGQPDHPGSVPPDGLDDEDSMQTSGLFLMLHEETLGLPTSHPRPDASNGWLDWGRLRGPGEPEDHSWSSSMALYHDEQWIHVLTNTGVRAWQIGKDAPE